MLISTLRAVALVGLGLFLFTGCNDTGVNTNQSNDGFSTAAPTDGALAGGIRVAGYDACSGIEVAVVGPDFQARLTSAAGELIATGLAAGAYEIQPLGEVVTFSPLQVVVDGRNETTFNAITADWPTATITGTVELADDADPAGTQISLSGDVDTSLPDGVECASGRGDVDLSDVIGSTDGRGRYRVEVPSRARDVRVRSSRNGYTNAETPVEDSRIRANASVRLPTTTLYPLTGFINIVAGSVTNQSTIGLQISAFNGVSEMGIGQETESGCQYGDWTPYDAAPEFSLSGDDGFKTVCVRVRNSFGQTLDQLQDTVQLDRVAPAGSLVINGGDTGTADALVTLTIAAGDTGVGVAGVRLANQASAITGAALVPFEVNKLWTLTPGDGFRAVWMQVQDVAGNRSTPVSTGILVDSGVPDFAAEITGSEGVPGSTADTTVWVQVTSVASDVVDMQISTQSGFAGASWFAVTSKTSWQIQGSDGSKTLYVRVRDRAGNVSTTRSPSIVLDTTPPDIPSIQVLDITNDDFPLSATSIELSWSIPSDPLLARFELERFVLGVDNAFQSQHTAAEDVGSYIDFGLASTGAMHQYRIRAVDDLGNVSGWSAIASALPYAPIERLYWVKEVDGYRFDFPPGKGTFSMVPRLEYVSDAGLNVSEGLVVNLPYHKRFDPGELRLNEQILVRTGNQDNNLVYESTLPLGLNFSQVVNDDPGSFGWFGTSLWIENDDTLHYANWHAFDEKVEVARFKDGQWTVEQIEDGNFGGWTPAIAVAPNGNRAVVYYVYSAGGAGAEGFYFAHDATGTWSPRFITEGAGTAAEDADLLIDRDGGVHFVQLSRPSVDRITYGYAPAVTADFVYETVTSRTFSEGNLAYDVRFRIASDGSKHVFYAERPSGGNYRFRHRYNSGAGWQDGGTLELQGNAVPRCLAADVDGYGNMVAIVSDAGAAPQGVSLATRAWPSSGWSIEPFISEAVDWDCDLDMRGRGRVELVYRSNNDELVHAVTDETGWIFSTLAQGSTVGQQAKMRIDSAGVARVVYGESGDEVPVYLQYVENGREPQDVVENATNPDFVVAPDGTVHLSFATNWDSFGSKTGDMAYADNATGAWRVEVAQTLSCPACGNLPTQRSRIISDRDNNLHYFHTSVDPIELRYLGRHAAADAFVVPVTIANSPTDIRHVSVAVHEDRLAVAYWLTNGELYYGLKSTDPLDGAWSTRFVTDGTYDGNFLLGAVDFDSQGNLHIGYRTGSAQLHHALIAGPGYGTVVSEPIDIQATNWLGRPVLAVGASDIPYIIYRDNSNEDGRIVYKDGDTWKDELLVDESGVQSCQLVADSAGVLHGLCSLSGNVGVYVTNASGDWTTHRLAHSGTVKVGPNNELHMLTSAGSWTQHWVGFSGSARASQVVRVPPF